MTEHDGTQTSEQAETNISAASALRTSENTLRDSEASNLPLSNPLARLRAPSIPSSSLRSIARAQTMH